MPVLPLVASTSVAPGLRSPELFGAEDHRERRSIFHAARWIRDFHLGPHGRAAARGLTRPSRTSGVFPMSDSASSAIFKPPSVKRLFGLFFIAPLMAPETTPFVRRSARPRGYPRKAQATTRAGDPPTTSSEPGSKSGACTLPSGENFTGTATVGDARHLSHPLATRALDGSEARDGPAGP